MIGDIYFNGNSVYKTRWLINFASYSSLSFSGTDIITYSDVKFGRMVLENSSGTINTHMYGYNTWTIDSTPQFVT